MSLYRTSRQGEQLVRDALQGSEWATTNGHDIDWQGIKIDVKTRGKAGKMGNTAFVFSHFKQSDCVYVLVAMSDEAYYFWVVSGKEIGNKKSLYVSLKDAIPYPDLANKVRIKAAV